MVGYSPGERGGIAARTGKPTRNRDIPPRGDLPDPGDEARERFLLLAEARRLGMYDGPVNPATTTQLPGELMIERLLATRVYSGVHVADADLPSWYEAHRSEFARPDQIRVHHFFVPRPPVATAAAVRDARAEAQRLLREASSEGSGSFALSEELTRRDPRGRRWGDIGYFSRGTFPAAVDDALFALRRFGETALVELPDGFHIFRLMALRPGRKYGFAEVREAVRERATRDARVRAAREFAAALAARGDDADLVYIPGGYFWMGSTTQEIGRAWQMALRFAGRTRKVRREWFEDEEYRPVLVRPFLMDRHEVTVDQYRAFLQSSGRQPPPDWNSGAIAGRLPVTGVSWEDARTYAVWAGKRLPTAEEWEWAARGAARRWFPWGDTPPDGSRANYADAGTDLPWNDQEHNDGHPVLAPVGSYPAGATPEGVLDLAGNAREWTATARLGIIDPADQHIWDWTQRHLVRGGENLPAVGMYAVRGGSWDGAADDLRASDARMLPPATRHRALGFRCVGDIP